MVKFMSKKKQKFAETKLVYEVQRYLGNLELSEQIAHKHVW